jgi:PD-(D/E)XK nuclease superfamily protein
MAAADPFAEASEATPRLTLSALFRNDASYRGFYRTWQDMTLGIAAEFGDFLNLSLARTFELYELWCFSCGSCARQAKSSGQRPRCQQPVRQRHRRRPYDCSRSRNGPGRVGLENLLSAAVPRFLDFLRSSRILQPHHDSDVVAAQASAVIGNTGRLIVLDAKYRIDDGLNDALSSIHTYRDALVREAESGKIEGIVTAAYLLTPHNPALLHGYRETPMPGRIFHPDYRAGFQFGAVRLRPGMTPTEITAALHLIIDDATASR